MDLISSDTPLPISKFWSLLTLTVISLSTLQLLPTNDWLALCRLSFASLHHLWTHFLQLWHKIELLPTVVLHKLQGHLLFSSTLSNRLGLEVRLLVVAWQLMAQLWTLCVTSATWGSMLPSDASLDAKIKFRLSKASCCFDHLKYRL